MATKTTAVETPQIRQGEATPEGTQLPKGGAQQVNEAVAAAATAGQPAPTQGQRTPQAPSVAPETPETPLSLVPRPRQGPMPLQNEEDNLLFGPTSRPWEPISTGVTPSGRISPPASVNNILPYLVTASKDPDAPPQLRGLVQLLMHQMQQT